MSSDYKIPLEVAKGHRPPKPEGVGAIGFDDATWATMQKCWVAKPFLRPSCVEVLNAFVFSDKAPRTAETEKEELSDIYALMDVRVRDSVCSILALTS